MNQNQLTPEELQRRAKINKKIFTALAVIFTALACFWLLDKCNSKQGDSMVRIDITEIMGKTPQEVEKVLGKALDTIQTKPSKTPCPPCQTMNYTKGTSVTYMEGVAEWVALDTLGMGIPITNDAMPLEYLGIKTSSIPKDEGSASKYDFVWENVNGIRLIRMHIKSDENVSTGVYIKRKYM
jgi:hypothetical protein